MNDHFDDANDFDAILDDALTTYPIASAPATIVPGVMARIETMNPRPRFQLTRSDFAFGLCGAALIGLGILIWQMLAPLVIVSACDQYVSFMRKSDSMVWVVPLVGGMVVIASTIALGALAFNELFSTRVSRRLF